MFVEALESILEDHCTSAVVRSIEAGGSAAALQAAIADAGFLELLADEADGGAGLTMQELYPVVALCGSHAVPLPVVQTLAARLLALNQAELPDGMVTFAPALSVVDGGGLHCPLVPFAVTSDHVIAPNDDTLWLLPVAEARRIASGVHGSLAATLQWDADAGKALPSALRGKSLQALGAVLHAGLLAGAMKRVFR